MSNVAQQLHFLLVPAQSDGHINALLRLAHALVAEKGVLVTFGYPARYHSLALKRNMLSSLLSSSSSAHSNSMLRVEVVEDGLPLEEELTLTTEHRRSSFLVFQNAIKLLVHDLLHKSKPSSTAPLPPLHCIISDTFAPWTQDLADDVGIPRVDFWASTAAVYSMGCQLSLLLSNGTLPLPKSCWLDSEKWSVEAPLIEGIPGLPPFPPTDLPVEFVQAEEVSDLKLQFMLARFGRVREAQTILVHSVYELESQVFDALQEKGFPIHAVGPLNADSASEPSTLIHAKGAKHECIQWLDKQPPSSVIYVAIGSMANFTSAEMQALALGLQASRHRFLWVIRRDSISGAVSEALPEGFLQQTVEKGLGLIISWSPQAEVLCHRSVVAFFSHCGWNSTLESIWEGVPMVACPRAAEQRSNARWIVQNWKIGVELERQHDGSFTKDAVERALHDVLALNYKESALHFRKVARSAVQKGGTSHSNLVSFLQHLRHSVDL